MKMKYMNVQKIEKIGKFTTNFSIGIFTLTQNQLNVAKFVCLYKARIKPQFLLRTCTKMLYKMLYKTVCLKFFLRKVRISVFNSVQRRIEIITPMLEWKKHEKMQQTRKRYKKWHAPLPLTNEPPLPPSNPPLPLLKCEAPFEKWFLEKTNNNLKSSQNLWKIFVKKFIFSKFAGLQACRLIASYFTNRWTPSQIFFKNTLSPPCSPHVLPQVPPIKFWRAPPPFSQYLWKTLSIDFILLYANSCCSLQ